MSENLIEMKYRVITPNDDVHSAFSKERVKTVMWPREPGYKLISELVEPLLGDKVHMEHVSVLEDFDDGENFRRLDMFVDDIGTLKYLTRNEVATTTYRRNYLQQNPGVEPESMPAIHGTAILFERIVWT